MSRGHVASSEASAARPSYHLPICLERRGMSEENGYTAAILARRRDTDRYSAACMRCRLRARAVADAAERA